MTAVKSINKNIWTPGRISKDVELYFRKIDPCVKVFNQVMNVLNAVLQLTQQIKIPEKVVVLSKSLGLLSIPVLPFRIVKLATTLTKALDAEDTETFIRSSLEAIGSLKGIVGRMISPFKILRDLQIVDLVPVVPFLVAMTLPSAMVQCVTKIWNLVDSVRFAWAIHHQNDSIKNNSRGRNNAIEQLDALKSYDINKIDKRFVLSKQCKLAARVDGLREKLQNNEAGAMKEVTEFYAIMKQRSLQTLLFDGLVAGMISAYSAVQIALLATPINPLVGTIMLGSTAIGSFSVWASRELFTHDNIFDPKSKSVVAAAICKVKEVANSVTNYCFPTVAVA